MRLSIFIILLALGYFAIQGKSNMVNRLLKIVEY